MCDVLLSFNTTGIASSARTYHQNSVFHQILNHRLSYFRRGAFVSLCSIFAMDTERHLQIINPAHNNGKIDSFPYFTRLPVEIRLEIWQTSLRRLRLIPIQIRNPVDIGVEVNDGTTYTYCLTADGSPLVSKLLRVSIEARQAALRFYRVCIPCVLSDADGHTKTDMTLRINPEHDVLRPRLSAGPRNLHLSDLLLDLRSRDPLGIGVLNLALDLDTIVNTCSLDPSTLELDARTKFTESLLRLRQVFFVSIEQAGRLFWGPIGGIHTVKNPEYHRSRPIMSTSTTFDRLARDPRDGIELDLGRVYGGTFDPRQMVHKWMRFLDSWDINPPPHLLSYRLLISTSTVQTARGGRIRGCRSRSTLDRKRLIYDRNSAVSFIHQEENKWTRAQKLEATRYQAARQVAPTSYEDLERVPRPAIGFWLFPLDVLGPRSDYEKETPKGIIDMGAHWPELCLAHLP
ncbi:hypothetical protein F5Y18DRAFT_392098 [Xylariaceae sp. FL1019]|nr:hypothetical protein F5Y18DRAFT_392098 [Xylariaceae sp. FL1019]